MTRKFFVFLLSCALTLFFIGCSSEPKDPIPRPVLPSETPSESINLEPMQSESPSSSAEYSDDTITGIVFLRRNSNELEIGTIDPETGNSKTVRKFNTSGCSISLNGSYWSGAIYQSPFDSECKLLATDKTVGDGSRHTGWIDQQGVFTDISELVQTDAGDFGNNIVNHHGGFFSRDGAYYYFFNSHRNSITISDYTFWMYRVPVNDIRPETLEDLGEVGGDLGILDYDGVTWSSSRWGNITTIHDATGKVEVNSQYIIDWIDDSHILSTHEGMIYNLDIEKVDVMSHFGPWSPEYEILPRISDRVNLNPVLSADRTKLAFLSYLAVGSDQSRYLFITGSDGNGSPKKVTTDVVFPDSTADYKCYLIDWIE